jgi:hypothetical protein
VGDEPVPLDGEEKPLRCPLIPAFKYLLFGEAIEGYIQLYRGKVIGVEFKPLFLGKVGRIEGPIPPMRIVIAACSDENPILNCGMRNAKSGICNLGFNGMSPARKGTTLKFEGTL